jgi:hypothetical protein
LILFDNRIFFTQRKERFMNVRKAVLLLVPAFLVCGIVSGVRADILYVADYSGFIEKYNMNGQGSVFVSGLQEPMGLACDGSGNVYVSVAGTVKEFTSGGVNTGFAPSGLRAPAGLAFDRSGNLYVADQNNGGSGYAYIQKFAPNGVSSTFASLGPAGGLPQGVACDGAGNVYVAVDAYNRIYKISPGGTRSIFANNVYSPGGLACDNSGNVYVAFNGEIEKFSAAGTSLGYIYSSNFDSPYGIAFDSAGNLYAANWYGGTIEKFSPTGTDLGVFASGLSGDLSFIAIETPEPATLGLLGLGLAALVARRKARR